jgi:putative ABC transport system permease protein
VLTLLGVAAGVALFYTALAILRPLIDRMYGLDLPLSLPTGWELAMLAGIVAGGVLTGLLPAIRAYRWSLADGMAVRT